MRRDGSLTDGAGGHQLQQLADFDNNSGEHFAISLQGLQPNAAGQH